MTTQTHILTILADGKPRCDYELHRDINAGGKVVGRNSINKARLQLQNAGVVVAKAGQAYTPINGPVARRYTLAEVAA